MIGGRYARPAVSRMFARYYPDLDLCPCITASEYKGCASDKRRASRWYQRRLSIEECAWHQGFEIPSGWYDIPEGMRPGEWRRELYTAIGNGVPVWMAEAFGRADGPVLPAPIIPERGRYYRLSNGEAVRVLDLVVQKLIPTGVEHRVLWKATDDTKHYEKASQFRPRIMEEIGAELFESQRYD